MAITRTSPVHATGSLASPSADLKVRQANEDVSLEELMNATKGNGRQEIVVQADNKDLFVVDAHRLSSGSFQEIQEGDKLELGSVKGKVVGTDFSTDLKPSPLGVLGTAAAGLLGMEATGMGLSALGVGAGAVGGMSAALALGMVTGGVGAALVGAALLLTREPSDENLDKLTSTLASSQSGNVDDIKAQLQ